MNSDYKYIKPGQKANTQQKVIYICDSFLYLLQPLMKIPPFF